jgi:hypothetical protein
MTVDIYEIERILKRHMAKTLTSLEEINLPSIALDAVKREYHFSIDDIKKHVAGEGYVNGNRQE